MTVYIPGTDIEASGPEAMPTYVQCITNVYTALSEDAASYGGVANMPGKWLHDQRTHGQFSAEERLLLIGLAVFFTVLRYVMSYTLFLPFARWVGMTTSNQSKFPESAFKLIFYSISWSYSAYIMFCGRYDFWQRPCHVWQDWRVDMTVETDIAIAYWLQLSFYLHSIYGTLFMDQWRKDSIVMLIHHFITIGLIGFSYSMRYHKMGMLVLFLHDISDICLEFSKCNVYMKIRNGKKYQFHDTMSVIGFLGFAATWFGFRLYLFPLKAVYAAIYGGHHIPHTQIPCFLFFNLLLLSLQVLHIYWFLYILNFLYKVATGQMKEVDDIREEDILKQANEQAQIPKGNGEHRSNGVSKSNGISQANGVEQTNGVSKNHFKTQ